MNWNRLARLFGPKSHIYFVPTLKGHRHEILFFSFFKQTIPFEADSNPKIGINQVR
jgi:hypothetical protein